MIQIPGRVALESVIGLLEQVVGIAGMGRRNSRIELADQLARVRREIGGSCTVEVSVKAQAVDDG